MWKQCLVLAAMAMPVLFAAQAAAEDQPRARQTRRAAQVNGQVKSIDAEAGKITVTTRTRDGQAREAKVEEKTYEIAKDAKVTSQGQAKTLADVAAGARVVLTLANDKVAEIALQTRTR